MYKQMVHFVNVRWSNVIKVMSVITHLENEKCKQAAPQVQKMYNDFKSTKRTM